MSHCQHHRPFEACLDCRHSYVTGLKAKAHAWWNRFAPMMPADISQVDRMDGIGQELANVRREDAQ